MDIDRKGKSGLLWAGTLKAPTLPTPAHLLGKPDPAGLGDPLTGVDASVDPDGRTLLLLDAGAEL